MTVPSRSTGKHIDAVTSSSDSSAGSKNPAASSRASRKQRKISAASSGCPSSNATYEWRHDDGNRVFKHSLVWRFLEWHHGSEDHEGCSGELPELSVQGSSQALRPTGNEVRLRNIGKPGCRRPRYRITL